MDKSDFFFCYTESLRDYLKAHGFHFLITAKAISNNKQFWLFHKTNNLDRCVSKFTQEKRVV